MKSYFEHAIPKLKKAGKVELGIATLLGLMVLVDLCSNGKDAESAASYSIYLLIILLMYAGTKKAERFLRDLNIPE